MTKKQQMTGLSYLIGLRGGRPIIYKVMSPPLTIHTSFIHPCHLLCSTTFLWQPLLQTQARDPQRQQERHRFAFLLSLNSSLSILIVAGWWTALHKQQTLWTFVPGLKVGLTDCKAFEVMTPVKEREEPMWYGTPLKTQNLCNSAVAG